MAVGKPLDPNSRGMLEQLYHDYAGRMYDIAFSVLRNCQDSEDAVGEAFEKIAKNLTKLEGRPQKEVQGFCAVVTRNTAMDKLKRHRREKELFSPLDESIAAPDGEFEFYELSELRDAVRELREELKITLLMYAFYGLTVSETADLLGVAKITVYKRIQSAVSALKNKLGNGGGGFEGK